MQPNGTGPRRRGLAAFGPYLEERKGTEALFQKRPSNAGHDLFLARDQRSSTTVLVHRLAIDGTASPEARQAVVTAAGQALAFRHPAVLAVTEVLAVDEDLILVQEFPGGSVVKEALDREGPLPAVQALEAMRQFTHALQAAQQQRLTLSQISPHDFILANPRDDATPRQLHSFCPPVPEGWWLEVDDPAFASPEQKAGQVCDGRSALYSTGATLAYLLTAKQPAEGESWTAFLERMKLAKETKAALLAVLHENPAKRLATPAEWLAKLDRAHQAAAATSAKKAAPAPEIAAPSLAKKAPPKPPADLRTPARVRLEEKAPPPVKTAPPPTVPPAASTKPASDRSSFPLGRLAAALALCAGLAWAGWHISQRVQHQSYSSTARPEVTGSRTVATGIVSPAATSTEPVKVPVQPPAEPASVDLMPLEPKVATAPPQQPPLPPLVQDKPSPLLGGLPGQETAMLSPKASPPHLEPVMEDPDPDPNIDTPSVRRASLASPEEMLLEEAQQAAPARRLEILRQILRSEPQNQEALRGLVENALKALPSDRSQRRDVLNWATALDRVNDPLGSYTKGRLLLQDAESSENLTVASKALTEAVEHLDRAAELGYRHAWFLLVQAYVNLHNVQQQAGNTSQAARTSRMVFQKIDAMPKTVSVRDPRLLAERLEQLLAERETQGKPHPQATFLRSVVERLHAVASEHGDTVSQVWLRTHNGG